MKAALISNRIDADFGANERRILELAVDAVDQGAELIVFPEAAATGLADTGDVAHDLEIAEEVPGILSEDWRTFAKSKGVWFAAGLLERDAGKIYDSCVLFDPLGNLVLHYRRIDPHWHRPGDDASIYCVGEDLHVIRTPFGRLGVLICGDLWDDGVVERMKALGPDLLLYPFLRARDPRKEWSDEFREYCERFRMVGAVTLAVNLFEGEEEGSAFGGAWLVDRSGRVLASLPEEEEGVLFVDTTA